MILLYIYGYIEKEKVYNIEGQLRGFQGSAKSKTFAPSARGRKNFKNFYKLCVASSAQPT